jgi:hypothetical protein
MPVSGPLRPTALAMALAALAASTALAACDEEVVPEPGPTPTPTVTAGPDAGLQEIPYGALLLRVPQEWRVHELSYGQVPLDGGPEETDDWLLLQTDPEQTCDLSAGVTPGADYGCAHVMVLGPGSIAVGHGLGPLTEDNPFALGTNPGPCPEGIAADLAEPDEPGVPDVATEVAVGEGMVPYREWRLACLDDPTGFELSYHWQRTWYLPEVLVVDNWETEGLADYLAGSDLH